LEETGIVAVPVRPLTVLDSIRRDETGRVKVHFALVAVLLEWRSGEGEPIEDATELGWFTQEEARSLSLFARVEELMALALAELQSL